MLVEVDVGNGVLAELPEAWTPIFDIRGAVDLLLPAALQAHLLATLGPAYNPWMPEAAWPHPVFTLWWQDLIELAYRAAGVGMALTAITVFPPRSRQRKNFSIAREGLSHLGSRRMYLDLHYRAKSAPELTAGAKLPTTAARHTETRRRDEMVLHVWRAAGYPTQWTRDDAFQAARDHFKDPADKRILNVEQTARHDSWARVRKARPVP